MKFKMINMSAKSALEFLFEVIVKRRQPGVNPQRIYFADKEIRSSLKCLL